jgi:hypothetical protein
MASASASASSTESEDDIIINFDTVLINHLFNKIGNSGKADHYFSPGGNVNVKGILQ